MSNKEIITNIPNKEEFFKLLQNNPGLILLKFGATWCNPCKAVDPVIKDYFEKTPDKVICCILDIDDNFELYGYMKKSRVTNGIPVILCYDASNLTIMPTDSVTGSNRQLIYDFSARVSRRIEALYKNNIDPPP